MKFDEIATESIAFGRSVNSLKEQILTCATLGGSLGYHTCAASHYFDVSYTFYKGFSQLA